MSNWYFREIVSIVAVYTALIDGAVRKAQKQLDYIEKFVIISVIHIHSKQYTHLYYKCIHLTIKRKWWLSIKRCFRQSSKEKPLSTLLFLTKTLQLKHTNISTHSISTVSASKPSWLASHLFTQITLLFLFDDILLSIDQRSQSIV